MKQKKKMAFYQMMPDNLPKKKHSDFISLRKEECVSVRERERERESKRERAKASGAYKNKKKFNYLDLILS